MNGTAVCMVSIGPSQTSAIATRRAREYSKIHGYEFIQVTESIIPDPDRTPHWNKLVIPKVHPEFERYLILDDDILINTRVAPPLPETDKRNVGLVKEPLLIDFDPPMEWLGNSGVLLLHREGLDLLEKAYARGVVRGKIPGIADQPAVNLVSWGEGRVERLDWRWNYILMADWLITHHRQEYAWTPNRKLARLAKFTLAARLLLSHPGRALGIKPKEVMQRLEQSYFVHLIWFRMGAKLVDRYLR